MHFLKTSFGRPNDDLCAHIHLAKIKFIVKKGLIEKLFA